MDASTRKKINFAFIAFLLFSLTFGDMVMGDSLVEDQAKDNASSSDAPEDVSPAAPRISGEKIIYACRLGSEEIPAVQIAEIKNARGQVTGIAAHVKGRTEIDLIVPGAETAWDYKSVSAASGANLIKVDYSPTSEQKGYDWVLTLEGEDTQYRRRVKSCHEVSEE